MANSKKQFMKQLRNYLRNMCVTCVHNETCNSPLHGHVTPGMMCSEAESISERALVQWAMRDLYNLSPQDEDLLMRRMSSKLYRRNSTSS